MFKKVYVTHNLGGDYSIIINDEEDRLINAFKCEKMNIKGELIYYDLVFSELVYKMFFENCSDDALFYQISFKDSEIFIRKNNFPETKYEKINLYDQLLGY